ncbi:magnesium transporter [Lachnotalea glycerini]|nr:magnesium transporter [Lachnotalea glycerini]
MDKKEFLELFEKNELKLIREALNLMNAVDLASLLAELSDKENVIAFRLIEKKKAAEAFAYMDGEQQEMFLKIFTNKEMKEVLDSMYTDDTVDLVEDMPANVVNRVLENLDKETRIRINEILRYPDDSAGSIMTIEYVDLHEDMTVKEALKKIKRVGIYSETIYTCYVIHDRKLLGAVSAKDLLIHQDETLIEELMEKNIISVNTHDDKEKVANLFRKYGLLAIPVVDSEQCIVGIVTIDDAIDVLTDETTEDMTKMAAMNPSDESYFKTSVFTHAKNRVLWLLILMLSATITGTIITKYEAAFQVIPILVSFIPMLMDTGGNCGSQSATLIIRGLAIDEINYTDIFKVMWKEFRVAILVSAALALANGLRIWLMYQDFKLALVIAISLIATVIISKLVGCVLPLVAKKVKLDPAIMAAPLITTLVDTCSICIYFNIATFIFKL